MVSQHQEQSKVILTFDPTAPVSGRPSLPMVLTGALVIGLLIIVLFLTTVSVLAEPVTVSIDGADGRDFLHPGEEFTISVKDLDAISEVTITGPDQEGESTRLVMEDLRSGDWTTRNDTLIFPGLPSPEIEGVYKVEITGPQDGSEKRGTASFRVESYHLRLFPDETEVLRYDIYPGRTTLHAELLDWKGEPIDGILNISISRIPLIDRDQNGSETDTGEGEQGGNGAEERGEGRSDEGEQEWGLSRMTITNGVGSWIIPFPEVDSSTLYRFRAILIEPDLADPMEIIAECGVVVHPVPLKLQGERVVLEGGGATINGPFYQRESVNVTIWSWGNISSVTLTDLLTDDVDNQVEFTRTDSGILFVPETASIYELRVETLGIQSGYPGFENRGMIQATTTMLIIVNDWPIEVPGYIWETPGREFTIPVHREFGEFFAVRGLLLDPMAIPSDAIADIITTGNTGSSLYEKGLLDSDGNGELRFLTDVNMPDGDYLLVIGIGSWEDGVDFHGLEFSTVSMQESRFYFTSQQGPGVPVNVEIIGKPLPDEDWVSGTVLTEFGSFPVENGRCVLNFDEPGRHLCIFTATGRDVTPFTVNINAKSILIQIPDEIRTGDEVTIRFTDVNEDPIVSGDISFFFGWVGQNWGRWNTLEPGTSTYTFRAGEYQHYVHVLAPGYIIGHASINVTTDPSTPGHEPDNSFLRSNGLIFMSSVVMIALLAWFNALGDTKGRRN